MTLHRASQQLQAAGIKGDVLATVLAIIGAETAGTYDQRTVSAWAAAHRNSGAGRDFNDTPANILLWIPRLFTQQADKQGDTPRQYLQSLNTKPYQSSIDKLLGINPSVGKAIQEDPSAVGSVQQGLGLSNPLPSLGKFLSYLVNPHLWIRVGEVLGGGILIAVGVGHMAGVRT